MQLTLEVVHAWAPPALHISNELKQGGPCKPINSLLQHKRMVKVGEDIIPRRVDSEHQQETWVTETRQSARMYEQFNTGRWMGTRRAEVANPFTSLSMKTLSWAALYLVGPLAIGWVFESHEMMLLLGVCLSTWKNLYCLQQIHFWKKKVN